MLRTSLAVLAVLALALLPAPFPASADEPPALPVDRDEPLSPVEKAYTSPHATGLLVIATQEDSQARSAGIVPGDILVAYDGHPTPTSEGLRKLIADAASRGAEPVTADFVAIGGGKRTVTLKPGRIGFTVRDVVRGRGVPALPRGTDPTLDLPRCAAANSDAWYVLAMGERGVVGFEHGRVRVADGHLTIEREVVFDGGERFGVQQLLCTVVTDTAPRPALGRVRFERPLLGFVAEGKVETGGAGARRWTYSWRTDVESQRGTKGDTLPKDFVAPSYLLETLACAMPREKDACLRFLEIDEGSGDIALPAALVAVGEEDVKVGATSVKAWRYDVRRLDPTTRSSFWVDAEHRVVRGDYGGAVTTLATKAEALAAKPESVTPKTAGD